MNGDLRESGPSPESIVAQRSALLVVLLSRDIAGTNYFTLGYAGREMCSSSTPSSSQTISLAVKTRSFCHSLRAHQTSARCDLAYLRNLTAQPSHPDQCLPNAAVHLCMQVPGLPVYGVAIPTVGGLRLVLDQLQAMQGAHLCFCSVSTCAAFRVRKTWALVLLCILTGAAVVLWHVRPSAYPRVCCAHRALPMVLTIQLPSAAKLISCCAGQRKVLWHNMREEPVLYINGNPHVVREANKPFANLEYTGQQVIVG